MGDGLLQAGYQWMMDFLSLCVTVGILTSMNKLYPLPCRGFDLSGTLLAVTDKTTQSSGQSVHDICIIKLHIAKFYFFYLIFLI